MAKKAGKKAEKSGPATIQNRRATFDYEITDTLECGIALAGSEVKSLYHGRANLTDGYVRIENGELWIHGLDIEPWSHSSAFTPDRRRIRKLLAHRREIDNLERKAQEKGLALIPLKVYFHNRRAKVLIGVARGKRQYDKREAIKEKDSRRRGDEDY